MNQVERFHETARTYGQHGWQLKRVLMCDETRAQLAGEHTFENVEVHESTVDAMWFARPSSENREAWELRLVGSTPYALFELFEPDEAEEDREDVRLEMEARLREYVAR